MRHNRAYRLFIGTPIHGPDTAARADGGVPSAPTMMRGHAYPPDPLTLVMRTRTDKRNHLPSRETSRIQVADVARHSNERETLRHIIKTRTRRRFVLRLYGDELGVVGVSIKAPVRAIPALGLGVSRMQVCHALKRGEVSGIALYRTRLASRYGRDDERVARGNDCLLWCIRDSRTGDWVIDARHASVALLSPSIISVIVVSVNNFAGDDDERTSRYRINASRRSSNGSRNKGGGSNPSKRVGCVTRPTGRSMRWSYTRRPRASSGTTAA